jgi:hypothetical protein
MYFYISQPFPHPTHLSKHTAAPFLKPMKTIITSLNCFHLCWTIVQVLLPSFFNGLPETSFFQEQVLVKSFSKHSEFFLNLCFVFISPKQHRDQSNSSVTTCDRLWSHQVNSSLYCLRKIGNSASWAQTCEFSMSRTKRIKRADLTNISIRMKVLLLTNMCIALLMNHTPGIYLINIFQLQWI